VCGGAPLGSAPAAVFGRAQPSPNKRLRPDKIPLPAAPEVPQCRIKGEEDFMDWPAHTWLASARTPSGTVALKSATALSDVLRVSRVARAGRGSC